MGLRIKKKAVRHAVSTVYGYVYWEANETFEENGTWRSRRDRVDAGADRRAPCGSAAGAEPVKVGTGDEGQAQAEPDSPRQPAQSKTEKKGRPVVRSASGRTKDGLRFTRRIYTKEKK